MTAPTKTAPAPSVGDGSGGECQVPPTGWRCTRAPGHDGPCAAVAHSDDEPISRNAALAIIDSWIAEIGGAGGADPWGAIHMARNEIEMLAANQS